MPRINIKLLKTKCCSSPQMNAMPSFAHRQVRTTLMSTDQLSS